MTRASFTASSAADIRRLATEALEALGAGDVLGGSDAVARSPINGLDYDRVASKHVATSVDHALATASDVFL